MKRSVKRNTLPALPKSLSKPKTSPKHSVKRKIAPPCFEKETAIPIRNLDGSVLTGVLHEPSKPSKTLIKQTCIELARAGFAAYRVDLSGNGDSEGRFEDATPRKMLRDLSAVIEYFRKRYAKIVLLGHSLGAALVLVTASRVKVDAVIAVAPLAHPRIFAERLTPQQEKELLSVGFTIFKVQHGELEIPYTITDAFVTEMRQLSVIDVCQDIHVPVLLVHGTSDTTIPQTHAEDLLAVLFSKDLLLVGGATHNFTNPSHLDALIDGVVNWLGKLKL